MRCVRLVAPSRWCASLIRTVVRCLSIIMFGVLVWNCIKGVRPVGKGVEGGGVNGERWGGAGLSINLVRAGVLMWLGLSAS